MSLRKVLLWYRSLPDGAEVVCTQDQVRRVTRWESTSTSGMPVALEVTDVEMIDSPAEDWLRYSSLRWSVSFPQWRSVFGYALDNSPAMERQTEFVGYGLPTTPDALAESIVESHAPTPTLTPAQRKESKEEWLARSTALIAAHRGEGK